MGTIWILWLIVLTGIVCTAFEAIDAYFKYRKPTPSKPDVRRSSAQYGAGEVANASVVRGIKGLKVPKPDEANGGE